MFSIKYASPFADNDSNSEDYVSPFANNQVNSEDIDIGGPIRPGTEFTEMQPFWACPNAFKHEHNCKYVVCSQCLKLQRRQRNNKRGQYSTLMICDHESTDDKPQGATALNEQTRPEDIVCKYRHDKDTKNLPQECGICNQDILVNGIPLLGQSKC